MMLRGSGYLLVLSVGYLVFLGLLISVVEWWQ